MVESHSGVWYSGCGVAPVVFERQGPDKGFSAFFRLVQGHGESGWKESELFEVTDIFPSRELAFQAAIEAGKAEIDKSRVSKTSH